MNTQQKLKKYLSEIEKNDQKGNKINAFLQINPNALQEAKEIDFKKKKGRLAGKIISVKAIINVKGLNISCGSKTLENITALFWTGNSVDKSFRFTFNMKPISNLQFSE